MKRALILGAKAKGLTSPNPLVGAVLVKNGEILSQDFHKRPGTPHAEALVLKNAGENAEGSTLYVNLEPCCHTEKRTPPCTQVIINAGVHRVVIGMEDPNPKVSGRGVLELQNAGIPVQKGILENEARKLNEPYIKYITTGKPFVILKVAMTLDGKIATPEGQSKWITGEKARRKVHSMRSHVDAIMTAIGTVKSDNPQLTARGKRLKSPMRIVIDPNLEIPLHSRILQSPPETMIVTKKSLLFSHPSETEEKKKILTEKGINLIECDGEKVDLKWLMKKLGEMVITSILIEGGSSLNAYALKDNIVDKVMFFIAPMIIGGKDSFPAIGGKTFKKIEEAYRLKDMRIRRFDDDILIEGYISK